MRDSIKGRVVSSRDPEALADAIADILEDRQKRERMAQAARETSAGLYVGTLWSTFDRRLEKF